MTWNGKIKLEPSQKQCYNHDMKIKSMRFLMLVVLIAVITLSIPNPLHAQQSSGRYALVIGNGNYSELGTLKTARNDAEDMAAALRELGFEVATLLDADLKAMEDEVVRLFKKLSASPNAIGLFYYAGHGVQSEGMNFLIPADVRIPEEAFLKTKALNVQSVLNALQSASNKLNIIILDACRDSPFTWKRSGMRGLSVVSTQPPGSIIVYSTSAGSAAQEGTGRNGVFTGELLKQLKAPNLDVMEVFKRTGAAVQELTGGKQIPAIYSQFFYNEYLAGVTPSANSVSQGNFPASSSLESKSSARELDDSSKNLEASFINQVPNGTFTLGSTKEEVVRAMGTPTGIHMYQALGIEEWSYLYSTVTFNNKGVVTQWDDLSEVLKLRWIR